MKLKLLFALLLTEQIVIGQGLAQKADTSNYYDYFSSYQKNKNIQGRKLTTAWLRINEVVPVIMDELQNGGYDWLYDNKLFKVDTGQYVVLAAYSRKSNFGFLYIEGHEVLPSKRHRKELSQQSDRGVDYISCEETPTGKPNFVKIKKLPNNIFILNENCYWYQYTENPDDNNFLITKEIAIGILRQDIKAYLVKAPKPKQ
jgi:hypothetical protein